MAGAASDGVGATAAAEWRRAPLLPFAGTIGHATAVFHINGFAPFIVVIAEDFGWSRTLTMLGLSLVLLLQAAGSIPIGLLVDRIGSRRVALVGMLTTPLGFALIGTATGGGGNWILLWLVMGIAALPVQSTVWANAISNSFRTSRGLALGVSMLGSSLASALFPWLGAELIARFGWQRAMAYEALLWGAVSFPFIVLFFRSREDEARHTDRAAAAAEPGLTLREGLRSSIYIRLLIAGALYTFAIPPLIFHFVAIATDGGIAPIAAAKIAAVSGLGSVIGRLGTGLLIDRLSATWVGAAAFVMPAIGCAILLAFGIDTTTASIAALLLGFAMGAELDVFSYLTGRYFGLRHFGSLFGGVMLALCVGSGTGPVIAARVFDTTGSYAPFMATTIGCSILCIAIFLSLPRPKPLAMT